MSSSSSPDAVPGDLPAEVVALLDQPRYETELGDPVDVRSVRVACAAVENPDPRCWDDEVAEAVAGSVVAPATSLSAWIRPLPWSPSEPNPPGVLPLHDELKVRLGLPHAVMSECAMTFHEPVRVGDRLRGRQVLRSISEPVTTTLGSGRFWSIDLEVRNQHGELAGVERYTAFAYEDVPPPDEPFDAERFSDDFDDFDDEGDDVGDDVADLARGDAHEGTS